MSQNIQTTQNCKSNQITMNCIDLTSKWSKMLHVAKVFKTMKTTYNIKTIKMLNVAKHSKQRKTTKVKLRWIASIWRQTIKNVELRRKPFKTAKLQKWSKYNDLHRFDVKTIKTTQNCKSDQITMNLHRFDVKMIKNVELCRKTFKQR